MLKKMRNIHLQLYLSSPISSMYIFHIFLTFSEHKFVKCNKAKISGLIKN